MHTTFIASLRPNTLAILVLCHNFETYKECLCNIYRARCVAAESLSIETQTKLPTFNNVEARMFQAKLDNLCQYLILNCFCNFNDYSMPILQTSDFTNYLNASKNIFMSQWAFLSSHCNINQDRDGDQLTEYKERQAFIFITLLILQCISYF